LAREQPTDQSEVRYPAGVRHAQNCLAAFLITTLILAAHQPAFAVRSFSILVMPIESEETTDRRPFSKDNHPFDRLEFDNTEKDFENIGIGYHYWLCGRLQAFAQEEGIKNITVRFISWEDAHNKIDSEAKEFDLIQVPSTWTAHLIEKGILAKLDGDINLEAYHPELLDTCRIKGKKGIYAVPWQLDLRVLYYTKELTDDPNKIRSFTDFVHCLESRKTQMKSRANGVWRAPFCIAMDRDWDILHNTLRYFWRGKIIEKRLWLWWQPVFDSEDAINDLGKLVDMAEAGLVYFGNFKVPGGKPGWYGQAQGLLNGEFDAVFGGFNMRTVFNKSTSDVEVLAAPLPQLIPGENKTFLGGCHLAVTSTASKTYARLATRLIERLTNKPNGIKMFRYTSAIPAHKEALKEFFESHPRWQSFNLGALLESSQAYPSIPQWAELETDVVLDNFHTILSDIASGQSPQIVELHVNNAATEVRYILLLYLLKKIFPVLIIILAISLVTIPWLIHRWRESKQKEEKLRRELEQAHQHTETLSQELSKAKRDILEKLKEGETFIRDKISEEFGSTQSYLAGLQLGITDLKNDISSVQKQIKHLDSLSNQIEMLESGVESILTKVPEDFPASIQQGFEALIDHMDEIRDQILERLPQSKASWSDITVGIIVKSIIPAEVKIDVDSPKKCVSRTVTGATAAWLAEIIRNRDLDISFHVWATGHMVTNGAAERAARRLRKVLQEVICDATGGKLPGLLDKDFFLKCYARGCYRFNPKELRIQSPIQQARVFLDEAVQSNSISKCINAVDKDPGNTMAWKKLLELVENSTDPQQAQGYVRNNVKGRVIRDLRHTLIRYLTAANVCYAKHQENTRTGVCGRVALSVADEFANEAKVLLEALRIFKDFQRGQATWAQFLADNLECNWLSPLFNPRNLEDCLCIGAICNSTIWNNPPQNNPNYQELKQALMNTQWFNQTVTRLTGQGTYNGQEENVAWWVLSTMGFKKGIFPGLSEDMANSLIKMVP